jgi:hypothetical protein
VYEDVMWYVQTWGIWRGKEEGCRLEEEVKRKGRSRRKQAKRMILEDMRQKKNGEDKRRLGKNKVITKQEKSR